MLLAIAIIVGVLWALALGFMFYDDNPFGFILGFFFGLIQSAVVITVVFVVAHFIAKYW